MADEKGADSPNPAAMQTQAQNAVSTFKGMKLNQVQATFAKYRDTVAQVLPRKGIEVDRVLAIAAQVIMSNPMLLECESASIIGAVIQAAVLGMNPSPQFGQVYFVPYGKKVQMQVGYRGLAKLGQKGGTVRSMIAHAVYEGDEFDFCYGLNPKLYHVPNGDSDPKKVTHAYCIVEETNGSKKFIVLDKNKIERLRLKSPMQKVGQPPAGPWATDYDEMAKAKAIKQMFSKFVALEDEWRDIILSDGAIAPTVDDFRRDGSGLRSQETWDYPSDQEPTVDAKGEVVP